MIYTTPPPPTSSSSTSLISRPSRPSSSLPAPPHAVQIAGGYADQLTRCAEVLEKEIDVDFIDVNMGCPIDLVCDKGAGSALLTRTTRIKVHA